MRLDATHDPKLKSWVTSANGHAEFPIQNLPLGVFSVKDGPKRGGVAIGDRILPLADAVPHLKGEAKKAAKAGAGATLNALFAMGPSARQALRADLSALLAKGSEARPDLVKLKDAT